MENRDYGGSDILDADDLQAIEKDHEAILDLLYDKVRTSDSAKEWLNTPLGRDFRKFLAADKMRAMKTCSTASDPEKQKDAQIEYAAICKLEVIFGSIIADGNEALNQLNNMHRGDTDEQE